MKKKTLKAILAAALAVLMVIPCISAFAADNTLVWDYYGGEYVYDYAGEITVGTNDIPDDASDFIWYSFDVQNEGFYYIYYSYEVFESWFGIPEGIEGLAAYNEVDFFGYNPENGSGAIFYLEAGKTAVGFDVYNFTEEATFEVEYLGTEITEIKPEHDLIYDYDVYEYEYMGEISCEIEVLFDITFSSGKTIEEYYLSTTTDSALTAGENTFTANILGKECDFTANVYYITDYVESVEISNVEDYLYAYEYYKGYYFDYPFYETIKVTFKDGSTYTVASDDSEEIVLPNGRAVNYGFNHDTDDNGNFKLYAYVGGTKFALGDCEIVPVDIKENIGIMSQLSGNLLSSAVHYFSQAFEIAFEDGFLGFFNGGAENSMLAISWAITTLAEAFAEITYLISYLLA